MNNFKSVREDIEFDFDGLVGWVDSDFAKATKESERSGLKFTRFTMNRLTVIGEWGDGVVFEALGSVKEPIPELPEFEPRKAFR